MTEILSVPIWKRNKMAIMQMVKTIQLIILLSSKLKTRMASIFAVTRITPKTTKYFLPTSSTWSLRYSKWMVLETMGSLLNSKQTITIILTIIIMMCHPTKTKIKSKNKNKILFLLILPKETPTLSTERKIRI